MTKIQVPEDIVGATTFYDEIVVVVTYGSTAPYLECLSCLIAAEPTAVNVIDPFLASYWLLTSCCIPP